VVFISYSHTDVRYLKRLQVHLRPLEREIGLNIWSDTRLVAGNRWRDEIAEAIDSAKIAILLVSANFLASDFIAHNELPPLLRAAECRGMVVLPVILSACRFTSTDSISCFQAFNDPARPVVGMPYAEKEALWNRVAQTVQAISEGRKASEGWAVANERIVREALQKLVNGGVRKSYLILQSGDYYVQLKYYPEEAVLYCEAVSDYYLPEGAGLTKRAADALTAMGFREPNEQSGFNYSVPIDIAPGRTPLRDVAPTVVKVFQDIYKVGHRSNLEAKFGAEDDPG
jgi:hypothetical protein